MLISGYGKQQYGHLFCIGVKQRDQENTLKQET
jgi:hypothetical protein